VKAAARTRKTHWLHNDNDFAGHLAQNRLKGAQNLKFQGLALRVLGRAGALAASNLRTYTAIIINPLTAVFGLRKSERIN